MVRQRTPGSQPQGSHNNKPGIWPKDLHLLHVQTGCPQNLFSAGKSGVLLSTKMGREEPAQERHCWSRCLAGCLARCLARCLPVSVSQTRGQADWHVEAEGSTYCQLTIRHGCSCSQASLRCGGHCELSTGLEAAADSDGKSSVCSPLFYPRGRARCQRLSTHPLQNSPVLLIC